MPYKPNGPLLLKPSRGKLQTELKSFCSGEAGAGGCGLLMWGKELRGEELQAHGTSVARGRRCEARRRKTLIGTGHLKGQRAASNSASSEVPHIGPTRIIILPREPEHRAGHCHPTLSFLILLCLLGLFSQGSLFRRCFLEGVPQSC